MMNDTAAVELEWTRITGTLVSYYFICRRKLWLHAKGLNLENVSGNADVIKGRILHETRFKRESSRNFDFDNVKIDFFKYGDQVYVHEVKKSKKFEEAHIWQLKYYIYTLQNRGVNCSAGVLHYPANMRKVDIQLTEKDKDLLEQALEDIQHILQEDHPPARLDKKFCRKCAYFDFCYV
ncbi:CRISPR-associated protein Cas4 [Calderihabitans maritimus]|uniref:CRISPR-associated exonuclease Cas4 n=1 Tax=Calderihabitans maritimus TaxID=1246530 RepID=A0A1Z5HVP1_9FIRM|nr:CRISPR-associated protein Cas4 [Calderihabitans maritimus]GAW93391.1 CRISPR-associated Cas4 family protein [Calderihabitans maritimus]